MNALLSAFSVTFLLGSTLVGCASGTAPAASAGDLGPDFALPEGDHVVPNPNVGRSYWTVVRASGGAHYLLPRPDGAEPLARSCASGSPLGQKLAAHALCEPASSEAAVAKVNALDGATALEVSTELHRALRFSRVGDHVEPAPIARDLLELCSTSPTLRDGAMTARCADEEKYADGGARPAIFMMWSEAELEAVPKALNALYGVPEA